MDVIWFFLIGLIFLALLALATRRWWARLDGLAPATRITLLATTVGGLTGALFWWLDVDVAFSWALAPLASRLLGAAATAFGIVGLFVLTRPTPARAWLHAVLTAVYLVPLAVAVVLLHLDRFNYAAPVTWGFFIAVFVLSAASLTAAVSQRRGDLPMSTKHGAEVAWHLVAGVVMGLWGLALAVVPSAPIPMILIWAADPLTSRLIGAMLLTLSTAFLIARGRSVYSWQVNLFAAIYGFGVVVAVLINIAMGLPWPPAYLVAFGLVGLVSGAFLLHRPPERSTTYR